MRKYSKPSPTLPLQQPVGLVRQPGGSGSYHSPLAVLAPWHAPHCASVRSYSQSYTVSVVVAHGPDSACVCHGGGGGGGEGGAGGDGGGGGVGGGKGGGGRGGSVIAACATARAEASTPREVARVDVRTSS